MKRLIITLKDITETGGGERVCVNLANALNQAGYNIEIISFFALNNDISYQLDRNINVTFLSDKTPNVKNPIKKFFYKSIYRYYLCYKIDNIITDSKPNTLLANDGWYIPKNKISGTKYVRLWHLNAPKKVSVRKKTIFERFSTLVILSHYEIATWQKLHKNIKVIPNFLPHIPTSSTDSNQYKVISVGRLSDEQKGFLRLIDIWEKVQKKIKEKDSINTKNLSQWQLVIVGSGKDKEEIESKIKEKNLRDSIILKPFTKDIESEYLGASIYAMSSYFEGFGMVLVEASSYALPCIAFDVATGPSDIIESNISGYLIKDNDLDDYAEKLLELMSDDVKRKEMGKKAKQIVKNKFSKDSILLLWEKLLCE